MRSVSCLTSGRCAVTVISLMSMLSFRDKESPFSLWAAQGSTTSENNKRDICFIVCLLYIYIHHSIQKDVLCKLVLCQLLQLCQLLDHHFLLTC